MKRLDEILADLVRLRAGIGLFFIAAIHVLCATVLIGITAAAHAVLHDRLPAPDPKCPDVHEGPLTLLIHSYTSKDWACYQAKLFDFIMGQIHYAIILCYSVAFFVKYWRYLRKKDPAAEPQP